MFATLAVLTVTALSDPPTPAPDPAIGPAAIIGRVLDADDMPVAGVLVSVCDAATGAPVRNGTWAPFADDPGDVETALMDLAAATTDANGRFRLVDVAPGRYRLLAQSWDAQPTPPNALSTNGRTVRVRGLVEIDLQPGETESVELLPLGTAILILGDHAGNDDTLVMVSLGAPLADPIVGFFAWPGPFLQELVAFNRMPDGVSTIRGLPAGDAHVVVFSADNVPGFGATSVTLDPAWPTCVEIPFVVTWSDGVHSPPPRLAAHQPRGLEYFQRLAEILRVEPVEDRDLMMMAMLRPLGIRPGEEFDPNSRQSRILAEGAVVGEAMARANSYERRFDGARLWAGKRWELALFITDTDQDLDTHTQLDERASWFYEAIGVTDGMMGKTVGAGQVYLEAQKDA